MDVRTLTDPQGLEGSVTILLVRSRSVVQSVAGHFPSVYSVTLAYTAVNTALPNTDECTFLRHITTAKLTTVGETKL